MGKIKEITRKSCFIKAKDDFYGNYSNSTVSLSIHKTKSSKWWIGIWGNDDTGYEKEFEDCQTAFVFYNFLKEKFSKIGITKDYLEKQNFKTA